MTLKGQCLITQVGMKKRYAIQAANAAYSAHHVIELIVGLLARGNIGALRGSFEKPPEIARQGSHENVTSM